MIGETPGISDAISQLFIVVKNFYNSFGRGGRRFCKITTLKLVLLQICWWSFLLYEATRQKTQYILIIKPTRCTNFSNFIFGIKLYMFRTVPLSTISGFSLYTQQRYMSCSLRAGSGRSVLILLASSQQTCMTYTIAVCTVKNS